MVKLIKNVLRNPLFVVVIYIIFGFLWIKYSDLFLESIVHDTARLTELQTYKGWLFIGVTSTLLYFLILNNIKANIKHEQYRLHFMMSTPVPLLVLSKSGDIIFLNESFTETYGYTLEDIPDTAHWIVLAYPDEEYRAMVMEEWKKATAAPTTNKYYLFTINDKKGQNHEVRFYLINQEEHFILLCIDITKEHELEMRLHQAEKMNAIGQLAGGIAHDFNNQLMVIQGYTELLGEDNNFDKEGQKAVKLILQAVNYSQELTSQLLLFSRKKRYELKEIDINEIVLEVNSLLLHTFPKTISITIETARSPLICKGNSNLLVNAILNIAINARDAMEGSGRLTIKANSRERLATLTITDTGGGIPASVFPHIFEPFYTTKDEGKGTGMGLSTVYATVEVHGGTISVDSREGEGTTFTITIPLLERRKK